MLDVRGLLGRSPDRDAVLGWVARAAARTGAVSPFVAGTAPQDVVPAAREAARLGMSVSVLPLPGPGGQGGTRQDLFEVIDALAAANLSDGADLVVDLADLGLSEGIAESVVSADLALLCRAADEVGMTVTLASPDPRHLGACLTIHAGLVESWPHLGFTVCADLLRAEADCGDLARLGARVRLVRGELAGGSGLVFTSRHEIDLSYVRCMRVLLGPGARPTWATRDPRLVEIATALAVRNDRQSSTYGFEFRLGVVPEAAAELVASGVHVALLVPYGAHWPAYVSRHVGVRPSTVGVAARAALGR